MAINREMLDGTLILEDMESGEKVEIRETEKDGRMIIAPIGRLSSVIAHDLEDELTSIALVCRHMTVDMSGVTYATSSVIRMLLDVQHIIDSLEGELVLTGLNSELMSRFEEMGLDAVFDIEEIR